MAGFTHALTSPSLSLSPSAMLENQLAVAESSVSMVLVCSCASSFLSVYFSLYERTAET